MSKPVCQNGRCGREIRDDGPSMYYCSPNCATFDTFSWEVANRKRTHGNRAEPREDPTCWSTRSAHPHTARARVAEAYPWLDVRAAG